MRLVLFTLYPLALGGGIVLFDRSASDPVRRLEAMIIPLSIVGVGGAGMTRFVELVFVGGAGAEVAGWGAGRTAQLLAGFASLGVAVLGAVAGERRGRIREIAVGAALVLGVLPQAVDWLITGVVLGALVMRLRRVETEAATIVLRGWMVPVRRGAVAAVAAIAAGMPVGSVIGQSAAASLAAIAVGAVTFGWVVARSPSHRASAEAR